MEGAFDQDFWLREDLTISALVSCVGTSNLDIYNPDSLVDFVTQSTFESILTGPNFDLPPQEIKNLPMLLDANESRSAPLESYWSFNALAVSSAESVYSYPEVLTLDEDYDEDYDVTEEERGAESVRSDPTDRSGSEQLVHEKPVLQAQSTESTGSSNYDGEAEELSKRKRRKLV